MLEKELNGRSALVAVILVPVGIGIFILAAAAYLSLDIGSLRIPALIFLVVLLLRDFLVARKTSTLHLDAFHWVAIFLGVLSFLSKGNEPFPDFWASPPNCRLDVPIIAFDSGFFSDFFPSFGVIVTLILIAIGVVLSRYSGKTRSLGRVAGGYLAALTLSRLSEVWGFLASLVLVLFLAFFGDYFYKILPRK